MSAGDIINSLEALPTDGLIGRARHSASRVMLITPVASCSMIETDVNTALTVDPPVCGPPQWRH